MQGTIRLHEGKEHTASPGDPPMTKWACQGAAGLGRRGPAHHEELTHSPAFPPDFRAISATPLCQATKAVAVSMEEGGSERGGFGIDWHLSLTLSIASNARRMSTHYHQYPQTNVRRPKTATDCPPLSGLCSIPSGMASDGRPIYGCGTLLD